MMSTIGKTQWWATIAVAVLVSCGVVKRLEAELILGGTATFTFDEALAQSVSPVYDLNAVFKGTQSYIETLDSSNPGDPFDQVTGTTSTVTFAVNGTTPAVITGRPNNAATTLDYDANDLLGSWTAGTDIGAFLLGGEQIGIQGMTRWVGDFTGSLLFGDFAVRHAPGRANGVRSGLVLTSNVDFANATFADLANIQSSVSAQSISITGDLLYADGFALLTNDPTDAGQRFGTFMLNLTTVPEPSTGLLGLGALAMVAVRARRRRDKLRAE